MLILTMTLIVVYFVAEMQKEKAVACLGVLIKYLEVMFICCSEMTEVFLSFPKIFVTCSTIMCH